MNGGLVILSGNSNGPLALDIAGKLEAELGEASVGHYNDGETFVQVFSNVRNADVYIVQSISRPANDHLMELILLADACRRASAWRINAVIPYFGYGRQDRKVSPRVPISAKVTARLLEAVGVNRVVTVDLHAGQIQGFFEIPVDHLYAVPRLTEEIQSMRLESLAVVSPDTGGLPRARRYARSFDCPLAIVDWHREDLEGDETVELIGSVQGRNAIIVDDMIDTAGTVCDAAVALKEHGAASVRAVCTHAVLSDPALERLEKSPVEELITTDTINLEGKTTGQRIRIVSMADLIADSIKAIHQGGSVSALTSNA